MKPHLVGVRQCAAGVVVSLFHPTLFVLHLHEPTVLNVEGEVQPETVCMVWYDLRQSLTFQSCLRAAKLCVCCGMTLRHSLTFQNCLQA